VLWGFTWDTAVVAKCKSIAVIIICLNCLAIGAIALPTKNNN